MGMTACQWVNTGQGLWSNSCFWVHWLSGGSHSHAWGWSCSGKAALMLPWVSLAEICGFERHAQINPGSQLFPAFLWQRPWTLSSWERVGLGRVPLGIPSSGGQIFPLDSEPSQSPPRARKERTQGLSRTLWFGTLLTSVCCPVTNLRSNSICP